MCTNGINTGQFEQMIDQIDDHVKPERRWVHNLGHQAADAGFETVGKSFMRPWHFSTRCAQRSMKPRMPLTKMLRAPAA